MAKKAEQSEYPSKSNSRYIEFMMAIMPTKPLDSNDVPEMRRRFLNYLEQCKIFDMKVGNMNAYVAIGIDRRTAFDWVNNRQTFKPERAEFIRQVQDMCGGYREAMMQDGKLNPVTGIFWQKNFDGFKDQQEIITTQQSVLGELPDVAKLQQRYLDNAHCTELELPEKAQKEPTKKSRKSEKAQKG